MEAMSDFFAKNGSKDQRLAMFPYKMDTLYVTLLLASMCTVLNAPSDLM